VPRKPTATLDEDPLLTPQEVADQLRIKLRTLYHWRTTGEGPRSLHVGQKLRYRTSAVTEYVQRAEAAE
jgi:excisionase family DNA binding protein